MRSFSCELETDSVGNVTCSFRVAGVGAVVASFTASVTAQQPPRLAESTRSVMLSRTECNRLIDLPARPLPASPAVPVAAVPVSTDLRLRVDRETAQGVFDLALSANFER